MGEILRFSKSADGYIAQAMLIKSIAELPKKKLYISTVRVVEDSKQQCKNIYLPFGYMDPEMQIPVIQRSKSDLILSGETRDHSACIESRIFKGYIAVDARRSEELKGYHAQNRKKAA